MVRKVFILISEQRGSHPPGFDQELLPQLLKVLVTSNKPVLRLDRLLGWSGASGAEALRSLRTLDDDFVCKRESRSNKNIQTEADLLHSDLKGAVIPLMSVVIH